MLHKFHWCLRVILKTIFDVPEAFLFPMYNSEETVSVLKDCPWNGSGAFSLNQKKEIEKRRWIANKLEMLKSLGFSSKNNVQMLQMYLEVTKIYGFLKPFNLFV